MEEEELLRELDKIQVQLTVATKLLNLIYERLRK